LHATVQFTVYKKSRRGHSPHIKVDKIYSGQVLRRPEREPQITVMRAARSTTKDRNTGENTTFTCVLSATLFEPGGFIGCRSTVLLSSAGPITRRSRSVRISRHPQWRQPSLAFNRFGSSQPFGLGAFDLPDEFGAALERLAGLGAVALRGGQRPVERTALPSQPRDILLSAAHLPTQRFELAASLGRQAAWPHVGHRRRLVFPSPLFRCVRVTSRRYSLTSPSNGCTVPSATSHSRSAISSIKCSSWLTRMESRRGTGR
jgi:hypothetical protein